MTRRRIAMPRMTRCTRWNRVGSARQRQHLRFWGNRVGSIGSSRGLSPDALMSLTHVWIESWSLRHRPRSESRLDSEEPVPLVANADFGAKVWPGRDPGDGRQCHPAGGRVDDIACCASGDERGLNSRASRSVLNVLLLLTVRQTGHCDIMSGTAMCAGAKSRPQVR